MSAKRVIAAAEQIAAAKRAFWEETALYALRRAVRLVRRGASIAPEDREYIADALEALADREHLRVKAMNPVLVRAQMADFVQTKTRVSLRAAAAAVAGEHTRDAVLRAVARLRAERRLLSKSGQRRG